MTFPQQFIERMKPLLNKEWDSFCAAYDAPLRRGLRVNTNKITTERFLALFPLPLTPSPFAKDAFYLDEPHKAGSDPLHHAGAYYMQEPSAASAVTVLAPKPHEYILDLCAAPGGKSTQILAALGDTGLLWSNEYVSARARILQQNMERCGARRQVISNNDSARLCNVLQNVFDAVLVDAPCSGEGMFRKEPQALTEWSLDNIHLCAARQREILHNASLAVKAGGRLVYSTCTFAPEENEAVIAHFLAEHPDFSLVPIEVPWGVPAYCFDDIRPYTAMDLCTADLTGCRRIFSHHGGEGHFIALLKRSENATDSPSRLYAIPPKDPNRQTAQDLYQECFETSPEGDFVTFGDIVRLLPPNLPDLFGLNILCAGVAVAQVCKNRLEPCHAAYLATTRANCRRSLSFEWNDPRLSAFLHGEEIRTVDAKGWTAVCVEDIPVGFGKMTGDRLKNRYPKGLRLL